MAEIRENHVFKIELSELEYSDLLGVLYESMEGYSPSVYSRQAAEQLYGALDIPSEEID